MRASIALLLVLCACPALRAQTGEPHSPKLLLNAQHLRRLQRDRERQTERWLNFQTRVQSVPDSPERGFELALSYAVTHDPETGKQAVAWALTHRCQLRQVALVLDWAADQISDSQRKQLLNGNCAAAPGSQGSRDALFMQIATDEDPDELIARTAKPLLAELRSGDWHDGAELYAAFEYLYVTRFALQTDLRDDDPNFFRELPTALLLSLKPEQIDHPDWRTHIAALALVNLDPNLSGSQFLQGWALEDRQMLRDGEGVAYEFLWADPYLPGVGFQNLDPWSYDPDGNLFARADWSRDACWIHISAARTEDLNCPGTWQQTPTKFGRLTLVPVSGKCPEIPAHKNNEAVIFWKFQPGQTVRYDLTGKPSTSQADPAGMWQVPAQIQGKICASPDTLKFPLAHKSVHK